MSARRRLDALDHPAVEVHEAGPQERRVVHHAAQVLGALDRARRIRGGELGVGGRPDAEPVLGAREVIDADAGAVRGVLPAVGVRVDERGVAPVILRRRVRVEGAETAPARVEPRMERILHAGVRIAPGLVREREEVRHHVVAVLRVLPEALVELAPHPARHVGDDPVDGLAPVLVEIQILVGERAQQAAGLRAPIGVGPAQASRRRMARGRVAVLEPGHAVAQRGHGEAEHRRAHRGVGDLVQAALLEAAVEVDVRRVRDDASALDAGEVPPRARDQGLRSVGHVPNRQDGAGLLEVGGGVGNVAAVREQELRDGRRGLKLRVDTSAQGLALRSPGLGRAHPEEARNLRDVALPAARDHDEAALHQEAIAHVDRRVRIRARRRTGGGWRG